MSKGHIRERSGSWELKYDIAPDPVTGKRRIRYKTVRGSKRDAHRELRRLLGQVDDGLEVDAGKLTVAAYLDRWLEGHGPTVSAATREQYEALIQRHIVPALGGLPLAKVTGLRLSAFYGEKARVGLGPVGIRHIDRVLHTALSDAVKDRLIPVNPVEHAKAPKVNPRKRQPLSDDEYMAILGAAEGTHLKAPLVTILGTGIRRGELLALTWRNVDVDAGVLRVVQAVEETKAHGLRFKGPKTASGRRRVDLPGFVIEVFRDHRHRQQQDHLALGLGWTPDTLVFGEPLGGIWSPGAFTKAITRLAASVGVKFSPHAGRHEHFSRLLAAGCHPKVAQLRAGHSSISTTMDLYSHASEALQREAASQMDDAFKKIQARGGNPVANDRRHGGENIKKL
jgi:integrase